MKRKILNLLMILAVAGTSLAVNCPPDTITPHESFMLAFFDESDTRVRVRWSDNGTSWQDGKFPANAVPSGAGVNGVGAAADDLGMLRIVGFSSANQIHMVWGLGAEIWDQSDQSAFAFPPESAPSMAKLDAHNWLIAFKRSGGTVAVMQYNTQQRTFGPDLAPPNPLNTSVEGRPALTRFGNRALIAWRRSNPGASTDELVTVVGQIQSTGGMAIGTPVSVPMPLTAEFKSGVTGDPAVSHDHTRFLLTVPREGRGGSAPGALHGWQAPVMVSNDGTTWTALRPTIGHNIRNDSILGIAGRSDGSIIAIDMEQGTGSAANVFVSRFNGTSWSMLNTNDVLGARADHRHFALIAVGTPVPSTP